MGVATTDCTSPCGGFVQASLWVWRRKIVQVPVRIACRQVGVCGYDRPYQFLWWARADRLMGVVTTDCTGPCSGGVQASRLVW